MTSAADHRTSVALVGLGAMGRASAERLLERGHRVAGTDPDPAAARAARQVGVRVVESTAELAGGVGGTQAEVVVAVASADQAVAAVEDCGSTLPDSSLRLVVLSTVGPSALGKIAAVSDRKQWALLDSPVSGGEQAARAGTLAAMVAGDQSVIDGSVFLAEVVDQVVRIGEKPGDAQIVKLAHQLVMCSNIATVHAALTCASAAGIPESAVIGALRAGTARSWVADSWEMVSQILAQKPGDRRRHILEKDLALVLADLGDGSRLFHAVVDGFAEIPPVDA